MFDTFEYASNNQYFKNIINLDMSLTIFITFYLKQQMHRDSDCWCFVEVPMKSYFIKRETERQVGDLP